jgi:starch synthase
VANRFSVSVAGLTGTHPLDLARQLSARDHLAAYFTTLPRSRTHGVPPHLVHRHLALLAPLYALSKGWYMSGRLLHRAIDREFDRWASRRTVRAHVVHALAGLGRRQRLIARRRFGALTVCDAQTSHVRYQQALVSAEHAKWGAAPIDWDERTIASVEEEYAESDLILTPSTFVYRSFVAHGVPESRLAIVPYGVDSDAYRPMPKADGVFRILFVGMLSLRKGLPYLLDAVSTLRWPDAELTLRGGTARESKELLHRYRGTIPVSLVPPQPRSALKQLFSNASVLVLPSIEDAFGLVIGQALACGTPVIATTHTGGPDVIDSGMNGFIVPPGDTVALRDALTTAYENRAMLARMGDEARRRVERARGWGDYGDGVIAVFDRALRARAHESRGHAI